MVGSKISPQHRKSGTSYFEVHKWEPFLSTTSTAGSDPVECNVYTLNVVYAMENLG